MVIFENGQLVEGQFDLTKAYIEIEGVKHFLYVPKIEGTTPITAENLNKMQKDLIEHRGEETITARDMTEDMEFTLSQNYIVGNDSLRLYLEGMLLQKDVHYREGKLDGTSQDGDETNKIVLLAWGKLSRDYVLTVVTKGIF